MSITLWSLIGFCIILVVQLSIQALVLDFTQGMNWGAGPRDVPPPKPSVLAGRAARALSNLLETAPILIALAVVVELSGRASGLTDGGFIAYLAARCVYIPLYLAGIPWLRSFAWHCSMLGLLAVLIGILSA